VRVLLDACVPCRLSQELSEHQVRTAPQMGSEDLDDGPLLDAMTRSYLDMYSGMQTTRLSSKEQVILPKSIRDAYRWQPGTEFMVEDTTEGVLLRPAKPFPQRELKMLPAACGIQVSPRRWLRWMPLSRLR
jgi:AbrB family looped-hinge helix DNA binding protein